MDSSIFNRKKPKHLERLPYATKQILHSFSYHLPSMDCWASSKRYACPEKQGRVGGRDQTNGQRGIDF